MVDNRGTPAAPKEHWAKQPEVEATACLLQVVADHSTVAPPQVRDEHPGEVQDGDAPAQDGLQSMGIRQAKHGLQPAHTRFKRRASDRRTDREMLTWSSPV